MENIEVTSNKLRIRLRKQKLKCQSLFSFKWYAFTDKQNRPTSKKFISLSVAYPGGRAVENIEVTSNKLRIRLADKS